MINAVFWDITPCGCCNNRSFGGTYCHHHQGDENQGARNYVSYVTFLRSVLMFLAIANDVPSSPILVTLIMEAICTSETLDLTRVTA
jgi:hypothetical protein